jgi:hypothetical protein
MIRDLGLAGEIALLRPEGPRKNWSYDPQKDGPISLITPSGELVQAQMADWVVIHGQVVLNPAIRDVSEPKTPVHEPKILSQNNR